MWNTRLIGKEFQKEFLDKVVDRASRIIDLLIRVMDQMDRSGEERKAEIRAKIGTILEKELGEYELDFQEIKGIKPEEIARVKQEKMETEMARLAQFQSQGE